MQQRMERMKLATASMLALAACGGSGDSDIGGGGGGGGGTGNPPPGGGVVDPGDLPVTGDETCGTFVCSGDVVNISYNATDDELTLTGLPIDFQFQAQSHANARHSGQRNALGLTIMNDPEEV